MARIIGYGFEATAEDHPQIYRVLADAKRDGVIVEYDDGRGSSPWLNGPPGAKLRALRARIIAMGYRAVPRKSEVTETSSSSPKERP